MNPMFSAILAANGINAARRSSGDLAVRTPIDGAAIAYITFDDHAQIDTKTAAAATAFAQWRSVPAPRRGELIRLFGEVLRANKLPLAQLVSLESAKILSEGLGEVQEMIDICDFAVGLSRQLYGLTIASERPEHRMLESWHPLGVVGVISAFNFPVAVWAWNFALAVVCGDTVIWKPSEKTPLCALACAHYFAQAVARFGNAPTGLLAVILGNQQAGEQLAADPRLPLISATGSTRMGRTLAPVVAARMGRALLELGGNNGMIVTPSANLELALRACVFSAAGTAGQRCTTLRRLFVHRDVAATLVARLSKAFADIRVGSPLAEGTLVGPLIDGAAFTNMQMALQRAQQDGGKLYGGTRECADQFPNAWYARPALIEMPTQTEIMMQETFAPILYVVQYTELDTAIAMHNAVSQGLSSCIFTNDLREAEYFLSSAGSDCGIANVNIGPSGAEIGGAFGGEKDTGGGRESGSDAWRNYMRRATNTINYGNALPLAQGVTFDV